MSRPLPEAENSRPPTLDSLVEILSIPTLHTERLVLRPFALADAPNVQRLAGDRRVAATTLLIPHPYGAGVAEAWIETHEPDWEARKSLTLAVTVTSTELAGAVSLILSLDHRRAELGYWIGVPYWNRGFATEAAAAMVSYGFRELGLHRIEAEAFQQNPASARVLEKVGMEREGVLRQRIFKWDRPMDVVLDAVLAADWNETSRLSPSANR
jgi:ribosomal-protein-alanine N-acetyltransferase